MSSYSWSIVNYISSLFRPCFILVSTKTAITVYTILPVIALSKFHPSSTMNTVANLSWYLFCSCEINDMYTGANSAYNGATKIRLGLITAGEDGEQYECCSGENMRIICYVGRYFQWKSTISQSLILLFSKQGNNLLLCGVVHHSRTSLTSFSPLALCLLDCLQWSVLEPDPSSRQQSVGTSRHSLVGCASHVI